MFDSWQSDNRKNALSKITIINYLILLRIIIQSTILSYFIIIFLSKTKIIKNICTNPIIIYQYYELNE